MKHTFAKWLAFSSLVIGVLAYAVGLGAHYLNRSEPAVLVAMASLLALLLAVIAAFGKPIKYKKILVACSIASGSIGIWLAFWLLQAESNHPSYYYLSRAIKNMGNGIDLYESKEGKLPPPASRDKDGKPLLSWRVLILPYVEEKELYKEFHLDEPWDSPHNLKLLDRMPDIYKPPLSYQRPYGSKTPYQVIVGKGAIFDAGQQPTAEQVNDAGRSSCTILIATTDNMVPWTKPEDISFSADEPLPEIGISYPSNSAYLFGGPPRRLMLIVFADGKARGWFRKPGDDANIRAMITWNGGEAVVPP